ncbi:hypothetical protein BDC45DRAFT_533034 [Circinella umbellata]|nr:hypothetical protein BDC45DRAFT_533034 [Circinella umbellata]
MTDSTTLHVQQVNGQQSSAKDFGGFKHDKIPFGSKECCPYTSPNCSEKMTKDAIVTFFISYQENRGSAFIPRRKVSCPAGGYIEAKGTPDNIAYESFDANHKSLETVYAKE